MITANFSPCRTWRYRLKRRWAYGQPLCAFLMLNPSTADETKDDPTIRRCIGYAKRWGFGGLIVGNIFAYRATDPQKLYALNKATAIGPENDQWLWRILDEVDEVICGWGDHGDLFERDQDVMGMLHFLCGKQKALGLSKKGQPRHPLYLPNEAKPFRIDP